MKKHESIAKLSVLLLLCVLLLCVLLHLPAAGPRADVIDFESDAWILRNAEVTDHMDRKSLAGFAYLKDVEFENGVIEVDMVIKRARTYPGLLFRMQSEQDYERLYVRPHRFDFYPDAVQYTPVINGVACWQLYSGDGFIATVSMPYDQWVHLRLEVAGTQARLYIDDASQPALTMKHLKHGVSKGSIGILGQRDGAAYFSNFEYRIDDDLRFDPIPEVETPPGTITTWELSQSFKIADLDLERPYRKQDLGEIEWREVNSEPPGLVNISRYVTRVGREPDCILARTVLHSDEDRTMKLLFGYSDVVSIFLNDDNLFAGNSAYQQRDPSFLGIVGPNDQVSLPLRKGENELLLMVAETFGGWGLLCRDGDAIFHHDNLEKIHESPETLLNPESVVYDSKRDALYVSNFDVYNKAMAEGGQFLSKVSRDGNVESLRWISGLNKPTGMAIRDNTLFVVERTGLAEVDIESAQIPRRHSVSGAQFLNDIAVDDAGRVYVSDSGRSVIYRLVDGDIEEWLSGDAISEPNALFAHENRLIVGNSGDNRLKAVDLDSKSVETIAQLGPGIIDGIRVDERGNYIVSQWEGRIYRITPAGESEKLLDTSVPGMNSADFEYVSSERLFVIPTFMDNRIVTYRLTE